MENNKVVVVGSGISGLFASCLCAKMNKQVTLLSYGQGALSVAGGIIDLFGYDKNGKLITNPIEHIDNLEPTHPYRLIGKEHVCKAFDEFLQLTKEGGFAYHGSVDKNQIIPTAIGTFKPSCLTPKTIDPKVFENAKKIVVVGFDILKDFYENVVVENLQKHFSNDIQIQALTVDLHLATGNNLRDLSALDIARGIENPEYYLNIVNQLKPFDSAQTVFVCPPVLGEEPNYTILDKLQSELLGKFIEVSAIPPSVTGYRLDKMLHKLAFDLGVNIIEKSKVIKANVVDKKCVSLLTQHWDRVREYKADKFIIATGGIFGNGLHSSMGKMLEPIFDLQIEVPDDQSLWSHQYLFTPKAQPFATYGVKTNENMQAVDKNNNVLFENVYFCGRTLSGYDFCFEKSGNGVAISSAYKAFMQC